MVSSTYGVSDLVMEVLKRTVVGDLCIDNPSGSHLSARENLGNIPFPPLPCTESIQTVSRYIRKKITSNQ